MLYEYVYIHYVPIYNYRVAVWIGYYWSYCLISLDIFCIRTFKIYELLGGKNVWN